MENQEKKKGSRNFRGCFGGCLAALVLFFILIALTGNNDQKTSTQTSTPPTPRNATPVPDIKNPEPTQSTEAKILNYKIIHIVPGKRYDGGINYYTLIDPIDLSNDSIKNDIKMITKKIVQDNGSKISVEFHDTRESLDISYKQYGDNSLGRPRTQKENDEMAIHYVAQFAGELETGFYPNTLTFFPATDKQHPTVGKYMEISEFNPKD